MTFVKLWMKIWGACIGACAALGAAAVAFDAVLNYTLAHFGRYCAATFIFLVVTALATAFVAATEA